MMAVLHPPETATPKTFLQSPRLGSLAWRQQGGMLPPEDRGRAGKRPGRVPSSCWDDPQKEGQTFRSCSVALPGFLCVSVL